MKTKSFQSRKALGIAFIVLLIGLAKTTEATPIDLQTARDVGHKFVKTNTNIQLRGTQDLQLATTYRANDGSAAFHVFNMTNGFVIVAADDCATPILGYSDEGRFDADHIPAQMEAYLQDFVDQISYGKAHLVLHDELTSRQWASVMTDGTLPGSGNRSAVAPLLTSNWNQNCYYNSLCPEDANGPCGHTWAGCGPTSMGQIMRYWGYPTSGTGSVTYTPDGYPEQSVNFGTATYNWANMPDQLTSNSSPDQVSAVATLLWHCGVAAQANYGGTNGTSSTPVGLGYALVEHFNYSSSLNIQERTDNTSWMMLVKACLDLSRPILYNAWGLNGGHSFVCDGYDANGLLHFNWGYSGNENGYFALTALNVNSNTYNGAHVAIFDIYPQEMPTVYTVSSVGYPNVAGTITGVGTYNPGETCTLTANANPGYTFSNWTENNTVVSTDASYSFTVTGNRALVANYALPSYTINATSNPADGGTTTIVQEKTFGFDDSTLQGWTQIDADGDGYGWLSSISGGLYYGAGHNPASVIYLVSGSFTNVGNIPLTPDNYLVSPQVNLGGSISFLARAEDANYAAEHFGVAVSTTGNQNPNDFVTIQEWTISSRDGGVSSNVPRGGSRSATTWLRYTVDLSAYAGQSGYVAIRHFNCTDQYVLNIDDITIMSRPGNQLEQGSVCTVTATPNEGYIFESWTENGMLVSHTPSYSFNVSGSISVCANYMQVGAVPTGALNGLFSVSENAQVRFSQGNLQYQASSNTWRFAERQLDFIGSQSSNYYNYQEGTVSGSDNKYISQNYNGWIDLFGWGTSGWNNGNIYYHPYNSDCIPDIQGGGYGPTNGISYNFPLTGANANADWGVFNPISNGGNQTGQWRTLTGEEWDYLLNTRGTLSGARYAFATVDGIRGLIVLPDNWPMELALNNPNGGNYNSNTITAENWANILEPHGAVFLPAGGQRSYTYVSDIGTHGMYWASTNYPGSTSAQYMSFYYYYNSYSYDYYSGVWVLGAEGRCSGMSVRLVHPMTSTTYYGIHTNTNPVMGGTVTGGGDYQLGATCSLTASPSAGYAFVNWTESGVVVSSAPTYSFTVTGSRTLVANFVYQAPILEGSINSRFSVSDGKEVYFSKGNLQYKASTNTWRFAERQIDFVGSQSNDCWGIVSGSDNQYISQYYGGWVDLFGWGTSGWNNGNQYYYPYSTGSNNGVQGYGYGPTNGISYNFGLTGSYANADWGVYNAISNGGNQAGLWRTLTGDEWDYLLNTRNTVSGIRYALATVDGVHGLIIVPDNWPIELALNNPNVSGSFSSNTITAENWTNILEANGAVFLPAGGQRNGTYISDIGTNGMYWASTCYPNSYAAQYLNFYYFYNSYNYSYINGVWVNNTNGRSLGMSVRLVHEAEIISYYDINATPNPAAGGTVTGSGTYQEGTICTLTATANTGYTFVKWTRNGVEVSTDANYSFTVTEESSYVANFELNSFEIEAVANPEVGGTIDGIGTYYYGQNCTLTAIPATGYTFVNWTKDDEEVSTEALFSFIVNENSQYIANFQTESYTIAATATNGTVNGTGIYEFGTVCTLTAIPNTGYTFTNWTENDIVVSTDATYSFEVTGPRVLVANFDVMTNHWSIITGTRYAMTVNGVIIINGEQQSSSMLEVGAFCGEECRASGFATPFFTGEYIVSLTIVSNVQSGETINFRLYDHNLNMERTDLTCFSSVIFTDLQFIGAPNNWFPIEFNSEMLVSATVNPAGAGEVNGTGMYAPGSTATLTAVPNEGFAFRNWTIGDDIVSTESTYTFTVNEAVSLQANFDYMFSRTMVAGWNWWSTWIEATPDEGLVMLENSLGNSGMNIFFQNSNIQNYYSYFGYNSWWGTLSGIEVEKGYKVQVSEPVEAIITGPMVVLADHPITITPGWNWIGYPLPVTQSLSAALGDFTPMPNDMITGQNISSTYWNDAYGWFPPINLEPGQCYLYYSGASDNRTLVYASSREKVEENETPHQWSNNPYAYPDNTILIASVYVNDEEQRSEEMEIGAFVDNECRGSARLIYFEPLDRYYAILTIKGEDGDKVEFRVADNEYGWISVDCKSRVVFQNNRVEGSLDNPFRLEFNSGISLIGKAKVYPNPVDRDQVFSLGIPSGESVDQMFVYDALGCVVRHESGAVQASGIAGLPNAGIYTVKVICKSGNVYYDKVIVK